MKPGNVVLESIAYELPDEVWSSEEVENKLFPLYERLKLPQGRLELMTGIKERRFWSKVIRPSEIGALAGAKVLAKSEIDKSEIDLLIHCGVCRDRLEPATAAYVHHALGLGSHVQVMDISNACLGFLNAIITASALIESGRIRNALIVSGENGRPLLENTINSLNNSNFNRNEIKPYFANLTIGSAGVAAILSSGNNFAIGARPRFSASVWETDSSATKLCQGGVSSEDGLEMQTDSEELLGAGLAVAKNAWKKFLDATGWAQDTPERIICHQVGHRHRTELYKALNLDLEKDFSSFEKLGNVGSAALPITLALAMEEGAIQPDDLVALLGIGSGLSSIMLAMQF